MTRFLRFTRDFRTDSGSVLPIFALLLLVTSGAVGVAIDYGRASRAKTAMRTALDAATIAAALEPSAGDRQGVGVKSFLANLRDAEVVAPGATFTTLSNGDVSSVATGRINATLVGVLNITSIGLKTSATAGLGPSRTTTTTTTVTKPANNVCILLLDPLASQSLLVNSGADVDASSCEIHVKSTATPAAIYNSGSTVLSARTCIQGNSIIDNGGTHPNVQTGCATASDPFAGSLPAPYTSTCDFSNLNFNGGSVSLSPGVYCGTSNFNNQPNVTLAPGLYVIKGGGWNVDGGTWSGNGVTFYFADTSRIQFNSGITSAMHAPTSGTYDGILMFEPVGLARSPFVFDDSKGSDLNGLIYLPSRDMTFNSASKANGEQITMVFNTLILDNTTWNIDASQKSIAAGPPVTTTVTTTTTVPGEVTLLQ